MYIPTALPLLAARDLASPPPPPLTARQNNPILLVNWWCTSVSLVIILTRLIGRWMRIGKFSYDDRVMAIAIIPLLGRMGCVHVVLRWGTNNVITDGLTAQDIAHRTVGSQVVLVERVFYAAFLWLAKLAIAEFLRKTFKNSWKRSWDILVRALRWFLAVTFLAVIIATLSECRPIYMYWQVVPDPGPSCRQGLDQLIVMGAFDCVTDIVLVLFPITIVCSSSYTLWRKLSLCLLFSLSLFLPIITIFRVVGTIQRNANQPFRTLVGGFEIMAAAAVANALVLASFVRGTGAKRNKYEGSLYPGAPMGPASGLPTLPEISTLDVPSRPSMAKTRPRGLASWDSDEDIAESMGFRLGPELRRSPPVARPAPVAFASPALSDVPSSLDEVLSKTMLPSFVTVSPVAVSDSPSATSVNCSTPDRTASTSTPSSQALANAPPPPLSAGPQDPFTTVIREVATPQPIESPGSNGNAQMDLFDIGGLLGSEGVSSHQAVQTESAAAGSPSLQAAPSHSGSSA